MRCLFGLILSFFFFFFSLGRFAFFFSLGREAHRSTNGVSVL